MVDLVFWIVCRCSGCTCCLIFIVARSSKCVSDIMLKWKMKSWTVTRVIMWLFVWSWCWSKKRLSFCRTFNPFIQHHDADAVHRLTLRSPDVTLLTQTGGLVWAVRRWISGRGPTVCSKCHACMPVCKMYNPCTIHLTPQPCGKPSRSGSAVLLDKNDQYAFQFYKYNSSKYINFILSAM